MGEIPRFQVYSKVIKIEVMKIKVAMTKMTKIEIQIYYEMKRGNNHFYMCYHMTIRNKRSRHLSEDT